MHFSCCFTFGSHCCLSHSSCLQFVVLSDAIAHLARFLSKLFALLVGLADFLFTWAHLPGQSVCKIQVRVRGRDILICVDTINVFINTCIMCAQMLSSLANQKHSSTLSWHIEISCVYVTYICILYNAISHLVVMPQVHVQLFPGRTDYCRHSAF